MGGGLTFPHLLGVELLLGAAAVFFQTAYQVYLPGILDADQLPEANAKLQGTEAAAQVAGPGLAGLVTQAVGAVAGLLVDAVSFAVSAVSPAPDPDAGTDGTHHGRRTAACGSRSARGCGSSPPIPTSGCSPATARSATSR